MRREVWIVAIIISAGLVVAAAVLALGEPEHSKDDEKDAVLMTGIKVEATGPPNLTAYGLLIIPLNVTNLLDEDVDFKSMNITLRLVDDTEVSVICNGPDIVVPHAVEQFHIVVNAEKMLNISFGHVVQGLEYLTFQIPKPTVNPQGDGGSHGEGNVTVKNAPLVHTSLRAGRPFGSDPSPPYLLTYGVPVEGTLDTWVEDRADPTHIGIMVYIAGLSNNQVYINTSYGGGEPQWTNLYNDGPLGCYGMLMTDQSNIAGDMGWTWFYSGAGAQDYDITLSVTTYALGTHEIRFYAYDQETGKRISGVEITNYTVLGTGGKFNDRNYMMDTVAETDMNGTFVPGGEYLFNFTDTCRFTQYAGDVRSVLSFPYAERIWVMNEDGSGTELVKRGDAFTHTWYREGGVTSHTLHFKVQLGVVGTPASEYPSDAATYRLEDAQTGLIMSHVDGSSHAGVTIWYRPE